MPEAATSFPVLEQIQNWSSSGAFQVLGMGIITYAAILWLALIIWVTRDVIHRSGNLLLQLFAVLLNVFLPLLGLVIYLIIRPSKTLLEKYYEDMEYRTLHGGEEFCSNCGLTVLREFSFCPRCAEKTKNECGHCKKSSATRWQLCPYCGEEKSAAEQAVVQKRKLRSSK